VKIKLIDHADAVDKMNAKYSNLYTTGVIPAKMYPGQGQGQCDRGGPETSWSPTPKIGRQGRLRHRQDLHRKTGTSSSRCMAEAQNITPRQSIPEELTDSRGIPAR